MSVRTEDNNKRIAKNTFLLYIRMIITTLVSLYTARILLQLLGVEDFGIYNVVGGVVTFVSFINGTMTSATQRFLSFDLGKKDIEQFHHTYSMIINVFVILCLIIFVALELVGPWFVANKLVIPADRMVAAQYTFQLSLLSFLFSTLTIPFQSSIIAYERMNIYAYLTFADVTSKLLICYSLYILTFDKLIVFAFLTMLTTLVVMLFHYIYCKRNLPGCRYKFNWDKSLFRKLTTYSGWNLFGSVSGVLCSQGQTIILNLFFGPLVNAAKGISDRVNGIIMSFSTNFYMAVSPQIVKSYAGGDIDYMRKLVVNSSRYSFYLMILVCLPLIFNMESILKLWLGDDQVSFTMVRFVQWQLVCTMVMILEYPITMAVRATGNIKKYQICVGIQTLLFLPLCYIAFKCGIPSYYSMIILTILLLVVHVTRVLLVRDIIKMSGMGYIKEVIVPILLTTCIAVVLSHVVTQGYTHTLFMSFFSMITIALIVMVVVLSIGLRQYERQYLYALLKSKIAHK